MKLNAFKQTNKPHWGQISLLAILGLTGLAELADDNVDDHADDDDKDNDDDSLDKDIDN